MPKSVNKVILVGDVGKDPEIRYSQSGTPVANFSLATDERFKDRIGEWQERTEWHSIVAWQRLAEIVGSMSLKAPTCTSKASSRPQAGRIGSAGKGNTALKSSPASCCCSARGETAAATTRAQLTTRIMRASLPRAILCARSLRRRRSGIRSFTAERGLSSLWN
jgi:hypothetical protein